MKILFVDDDPNMQMIMKDYLEAHGFDISIADNGMSALEYIAKTKPDLVILDMAMPGLDGWEVAKRLRQTHPSTDLPILAVTAHVMANAAQRALEAGCNAYLSKPFRPAQVLEEVRRLISAPKP